MRRVPRLSTPHGMPKEISVVIEVIGNAVRTQVLRRLAQSSLTALELAEQLGVHHASVHRHLVLLEEHGLVTADVDAGHRRGQEVRWATVPEKVAELGQFWIRYASAADPED